MNWFLDPFLAQRSLNLIFPKECHNLQTSSKISLIPSYWNQVPEQTERRIHETTSSSSALEKKITLENGILMVLLKFINSLKQEPEPRLPLPPKAVPYLMCY